MEALAFSAAIAAMGGAWWWISHYGKAKGWSAFVRHLLGVGGGIAAMLIVVALIAPALPAAPEQGAPEIASEAKAAPPPAEAMQADELRPSAPNLGIGVDEYQQRLKRGLDAAGVTSAIEVQPTKTGPANDVANITIGEHAALVLSLDKDSGLIKSVIAIVQGDGSSASGAQAALIGLAALGAAAVPDDSSETVAAGLQLITAQSGDSTESQIIGDMEIRFTHSDLTGGMFFAIPAGSEKEDAGA